MSSPTPEPPHLYSMTVVSKQFDISTAGLRKWCDTYADYLSDYAAPPRAGVQRRFTQGDIDVLERVAQLRGEGLKHGEIHLHLSRNPVAETTVETPEPQNRVNMPDQPQTALTAPLVPPGWQIAAADQSQKTTAATAWMLLAAAGVGALVMLAAVLAALLILGNLG